MLFGGFLLHKTNQKAFLWVSWYVLLVLQLSASCSCHLLRKADEPLKSLVEMELFVIFLLTVILSFSRACEFPGNAVSLKNPFGANAKSKPLRFFQKHEAN